MGNLLDEDEGVALRIVGALVTLVLLGAVGFGVVRTLKDPAPAAPAVAQLPAADAGASVVLRDGMVIFFFASGGAGLAADTDAALAEAVKATQRGQTVVLSGFHDASGDPAANADLAQRRAEAVRDALTRLGAAPGQVALMKPLQTTGTGDDAEARRVELVVR